MNILKKLGENTYYIKSTLGSIFYATRTEDGTWQLTPKNTGQLKFSNSDNRLFLFQNFSNSSNEKFSGDILAPTQGKIVRMLVKEQDIVDSDQLLCTIDVMKMNVEIRSPKKILIENILVERGQFVNNRQVLIKTKEV